MSSKVRKKKYYVVWCGREPGIYYSWAECRKQTDGHPKCRFKSFNNYDAAQQAFKCQSQNGDSPAKAKNSSSNNNKKTRPTRSLKELTEMGVDLSAVFVDSSCLGNPGDMEYRAVELVDGELKELFAMGPFGDSTNNLGEFLAIVDAIRYLHAVGDHKRTIYSDSKIAIRWVMNKLCRTRIAMTAENRDCLIHAFSAVNWLIQNEFSNDVRKWHTGDWGEIPADYGRK